MLLQVDPKPAVPKQSTALITTNHSKVIATAVLFGIFLHLMPVLCFLKTGCRNAFIWFFSDARSTEKWRIH